MRQEKFEFFKIDIEVSNKLKVIEFNKLPFSPHRTYWLTNFENGEIRGNHAHKALTQAVIAIQGVFHLRLFDGKIESEIILNPESGVLLTQPGVWRIITDVVGNSIMLVLASEPYSESDYIRNFQEYIDWHESSNLE